MRSDMNRSQGRKTERGRSLLSSSVRAISSVASSLRSAGASITSTISVSEDDRRREQVQWAGFDRLELQTGTSRRILLLAYTTGFQVWDIEEAYNVREVLSKRDGPVAFLRIQPQPITLDKEDSGFKAASPLLLVVTGDAAVNEGKVPGALGIGYSNSGGVSPQLENSNFMPTVVCFYSMKTHAYVHKLRLRSGIHSVRCSPRIVAVALTNQICCYDAATLQIMFNVPTYPIPQGGQGPGSVNIGYGPMDVGPRWLAYVATHAFVSNSGRISPQSVSLSTASLNGSTVAHIAKESSKQIAAGIVTLGDMGYKTFTKYCSELLPDSFSPPGSGSGNWKNHTDASVGHDPENAGTVIVRDFVSNVVVAQFRPHTSPISALCFDPSGTLLVTASIYGHNLNVFRIMPSASGTSSNVNASHIHVYKLVRGVTNAVIQDINFSDDSHSIAVSSSRGTSHLFSISPFSVVVGPHNHGSVLGDGSIGSPMVQGFTSMCPWSSSRLLKGNQQLLPTHPTTLSAVCKVRNGNDGWCSTISNAAATARGKLNVSPGAVAAVFHNGGNQCLESQLGNSEINNQLWGFSPPGHVVQYAFHPNAAADTVHYSNNPEIASSSSGSRQTEDIRYEELQRWDVGRKSNMGEREDDIYEYGGIEGKKEGTPVWAGYRNGGTQAQSDGSEQLVRADTITADKHCWYLSNAEVHTHQRPAIWAKPEIHFHKIMVEASVEKDVLYGEGEIEKCSICVVEIKSKDLLPLASNNVSSNLPDASDLLVNQIRHGSAEIQPLNRRRSSHGSVSDFMVQTFSTSQSDFEMTNHPTVGLPNIDASRWSQDDVSKVQPFENCPSMDRDSSIIVHGHAFGKGYSIKGAGNLGVIDEEYVNGLGAHVGTNGNQTLCSDDNSDSFGSSTWDSGAEGETVSPSSVLQTRSISKQCLNEIHLLQGNSKSKSQEDAKSEDSYSKEGGLTGGENGKDALQYGTVEDTKTEDPSVKESSSTGEENDEDFFGGGMFLCEQE